MEFIERLMARYAVPEFTEVVTDINNLLEKYSYIDHNTDLEYLTSIEETVERQFIVDSVMSTMVNHGRKLLLKMFIVVDSDINIFKLRDILSVLDLIENSVESTSICYLYNVELEPKDQLIEWVNLLVSEKVELFEEFVIDVRSGLIDNIFKIHELKVPVEPIELDESIPVKIEQLKQLRSFAPEQGLIAVELVKTRGFKELYNSTDVIRDNIGYLESKSGYPKLCAYELIGIAIISEGKPQELTLNAKMLTEVVYKDMSLVMKVNDGIDNIMRGRRELC